MNDQAPQPSSYPISSTDDEIRTVIKDLAEKLSTYDPYTGNAENLVKWGFQFFFGYIELQNREMARVTKKILWLTIISTLIAVIGLVIAYFSYKTSLKSVAPPKQIELNAIHAPNPPLNSDPAASSRALSPK